MCVERCTHGVDWGEKTEALICARVLPISIGQHPQVHLGGLLGKPRLIHARMDRPEGRSGSYSTNFQMSGRELLTPDEIARPGQPIRHPIHPGRQAVMDLEV